MNVTVSTAAKCKYLLMVVPEYPFSISKENTVLFGEMETTVWKGGVVSIACVDCNL